MGMRPIQNLLWSLGLRFPPTKSGSLEGECPAICGLSRKGSTRALALGRKILLFGVKICITPMGYALKSHRE